MKAPLTPDQLRWTCRSDQYPCFGPATGADSTTTIGQDQAVRALELGIQIDSPGYNMFVTGLSGSGRTHAIELLLERLPTPNRRHEDRAFVHNFDDPSRPRLLTFPGGHAAPFRTALAEMVATAQKRVPQLLEEDAYLQQRQALTDRARSEESKLLKALEARIRSDGFAIVFLQDGAASIQAIMPVVDGKPTPLDALQTPTDARTKLEAELRRGLREPLDDEAFRTMVENELKDLERRAEGHRKAVETTAKEARRLAKRTAAELQSLEKTTVRRGIEGLIGDVKADWNDAAVSAQLDAMLEHMTAHPWLFAPSEPDPGRGRPPTSIQELTENREQLNAIYSVHIIQEATSEDAPVVVERHPTFTNLFGTIERQIRVSGETSTDFTKIRPGSLLRADGGFLIMYARDVLLEPGVWPHLMRVLRSRQLEIQRTDAALFLLPSAMKPDAIEVDVKLILIGDDTYYHLLSYYEEDFLKVFKVKAEFDTAVDRDEPHLAEFVSVVRHIQTKDDMLPVAPNGLAALAEHAVRIAGDRERLSIRFGDLGDVVREADYWARSQNKSQIDRDTVRTAVREMQARHRLLPETLSRQIRHQTVMIDTDGSRLGQINGLAVYGRGRHRFGQPTRITATVGAGRGGVINIEREAHLSGPTHDKGILILGGFLREKYGGQTPLALTASIAFEQSYSGVDGDSASLAELLALLSAISGIPISQAIAVTGSINQKGDVQAIGGVNEKIEGFFDVVVDRGLEGHGCVIPQANRRHLMVDTRVAAAAAEERFSVWTVRNVDEAIPLLFGVSAEALHRSVQDRLALLASCANAEPSVCRLEPAMPHRERPPSKPGAPPPPVPFEHVPIVRP